SLADGSYCWHVRSVNSSGNPSAYSGPFTFTVGVDTTPPVVTVPADFAIEATSSAGAVVTYQTSATDPDDAAGPVTCDHPSGSTFPVGQTTVTCSASDANGNTSAPQSFHVTVADTTPPDLTVPDDFDVEATGPGGAVVTYTVSATDLVDPSPTLSCNPPSGS